MGWTLTALLPAETLEQQLLFEERAIQVQLRLSLVAEDVSESQRISRYSGEQSGPYQFVHTRRTLPVPLRVFIGKRIELLAVFSHSEQLQMELGILLNRGIGRRIVNVLPQKGRSLEGLTFRCNPGSHDFHPNLRVGSLAALQESFGSLLVIFEIEIVDKSQVLIEAPVFRIRLDAALNQLHGEVRPACAPRRRLAKKHCAEPVRNQQIRVQSRRNVQEGPEQFEIR